MSATTLIKGSTSDNLTIPFLCSSTGEMAITSSSPLEVDLPTGASTSALQTSGNTSLSNIDTTLSGFVCDTSSVTVSSSVLASGASTSALQTSGNSSVSSIDTKTPSLGQALSSSSVPVVLASDYSLTVTGSSSTTTQQLTVASSAKSTSTAVDLSGFERVGVIVHAPDVGSFCQLEWSPDSTDWYHLESRQALAQVFDAADTASQYNHYFTVDALAKYVRVGVYNGSASSIVHEIATHKIQ